MKILRNAGAVLVVLILLLVVIGALRAPVWSVEVHQEIGAPSAVIHRHVVDLKRWAHWAGWNNSLDAEAKFTYGGPQSGVGASCTWQGPALGSGRLIITKADPSLGVWFDEAIESDELNANGSITYHDLGEGRTRVTWRDQGRMPLIIGGLLRSMLSAQLQAHFRKGLGLLAATTEAEVARLKARPKVQVHGSVHGVMMKRDWSEKVALQDVPVAGTVAVGALSELAGEITYVAGKAWLATVAQGQVSHLATEHPKGGAALLVVAKVPRWRASVISKSVTLKELGVRIAARASQLGLPRNQPVPFRLRGQFKSVAWHVIDGSRIGADMDGHQAHAQAGHSDKRVQVRAEIAGFYSTEHQGLITHHGSHFHAHIVLPEEKVSGHLDAAVIEANSVLLLPDAAP